MKASCKECHTNSTCDSCKGDKIIVNGGCQCPEVFILKKYNIFQGKVDMEQTYCVYEQDNNNSYEQSEGDEDLTNENTGVAVENEKQKNKDAIGVYVGVPIAVCVIIVIGLCYYHKRNIQKEHERA